MALGTLANLTETGNSTAHRYLQSLVKEGLAAQDPASGWYDLGPAALQIGIGALRRVEPVEIAARHMKELTTRIAAAGGVAIWTNRGPTIVRWYRGAYFTLNPVGLGDTLPLDVTACGMVFQAYLPKSQIKDARKVQLERFKGALPSPEVLEGIRQTRKAEQVGHLLPAVVGRAAPVFDPQGELACVVTTVSNLGQEDSEDDREALFETAKLISFETGERKDA